MRTRIPLAVLWIAAVIYAAFGLVFLALPGRLASVVDIGLASPSARVDFAAVYGGLQLGVGGFLAWCARHPPRVAAGLACGAFTLLGIGGARLAALLTAGGEVVPLLHLFLALELSGAAICVAALRAARRPDRRALDPILQIPAASVQPSAEEPRFMTPDRRSKRRVTVYRAEIPGSTPPEIREVEYEAVSDALHFACRDLREGRRRPLAIVEDGVVLYDRAAIERECRERNEHRHPGTEEQ